MTASAACCRRLVFVLRVVLEPRRTVPSPQEFAGARVNHIHQDGSFGVLGDRLHCRHLVRPASPVRVSILPHHHVQLLAGARVHCDSKSGRCSSTTYPRLPNAARTASRNARLVMELLTIGT